MGKRLCEKERRQDIMTSDWGALSGSMHKSPFEEVSHYYVAPSHKATCSLAKWLNLQHYTPS